MQHSAYGRRCEYWSDTPDSLGIDLQDVNIEEAQNYCKYMPGLDWKQPSCLVSTSSGRMRIEPCSIEYCGGTHVSVILLGFSRYSMCDYVSMPQSHPDF